MAKKEAKPIEIETNVYTKQPEPITVPNRITGSGYCGAHAVTFYVDEVGRRIITSPAALEGQVMA